MLSNMKILQFIWVIIIHSQQRMRKRMAYNSYISLAILACLLQVVQPTITPQTNCFFQKNHKLFILLDLNEDEAYSATLSPNLSVVYNFCQTFVPSSCPTNTEAAYAFLVNSNSDCIALTSSSRMDFTAKYEVEQEFNSQNVLTIFHGLYTKNKTRNQLVVKLICADSEFDVQTVTKIGYTTTIISKSIHGCPVYQAPALLDLLDKYQVVIAIVGFLIGFLFLFYGRVMLKIISSIAIFITVLIESTFISFMYLQHDIEQIYLYLLAIGIILLAFLVAYLLTTFMIQLSVCFVGVLFADLIFQLLKPFVLQIFSEYPSGLMMADLIFTFVSYLGMFVAASFTISHQFKFIIVATSFSGAYILVRSISLIIGGFPSEYAIADMYQTKQFKLLSYKFYLYIAFIICLAAIGCFYQIIKLKQQQRKDEIIEHNIDPTQTNSMRTSVISNMEGNLDVIHDHIKRLIDKYNSQETIALPPPNSTVEELELDSYQRIRPDQQR